MAKRKLKKNLEKNEANLDELGSDPGQVGSASAGQSGDTQGLSPDAEASGEDVEELAETDQLYEAGFVSGVEEAGDHPEQPVRTHEKLSADLPPDSD
jgi:hypothetical protein